MRASMLCFAVAALAAAAPAGAQSGASKPATPPPQQMDATLRAEIGRIANSAGLPHVPPADSFAVGGRTIRAGTTVSGSVAAADGPLDISGRVNGNAIALHGDVVVHAGGVITGDAVSIGGRVKLDGGSVDGEMRSLSDLIAANAGAGTTGQTSVPLTTVGAIKLVLAWFVILAVIGVGVVLFAEHNLDGVVAVLERHPGRAFLVGLLAELGLVPLLALLAVALAITIIGLLLIPFAIVAYVIAVAGLLALGFLAVARFTGRAFIRPQPGASERGVNVRAMFNGLVVYLGIWFVVAALTWLPGAQPVLRAVAVAVTWMAVTTGLGATVLSRAGTQHEHAGTASLSTSAAAEALAWQTPTPVSGVASARRPSPHTRSHS